MSWKSQAVSMLVLATGGSAGIYLMFTGDWARASAHFAMVSTVLITDIWMKTVSLKAEKAASKGE